MSSVGLIIREKQRTNNNKHTNKHPICDHINIHEVCREKYEIQEEVKEGYMRTRESEFVSVYDGNTCIVFIGKKFNSNTTYLVRSWLFNMHCSN